MATVKEIVEKWEFEHDSIKYVLYPSKNAKRVVISFTAMGDGDKGLYSRISWFAKSSSNETDTTYLFLNDTENLYYSSPKKEQLYIDVINKTIRESKVDKKFVYTLGNSMGGSGAIYHAIASSLGGIIVSNPQFDMASASTHLSKSWLRGMESSNFSNLTSLIGRQSVLPKIYVEYSHYLSDYLAARNLVETWGNHGGFCVSYNNRSLEHASNRPGAADIDKIISFMEEFQG